MPSRKNRPIRITDEEVVAGYLIYREMVENDNYSFFADDIIKRMYKKPMRVVWRAMNRASNRGYIECGVSLRSGWATKEGFDLFMRSHIDAHDKKMDGPAS